MRRASTPWSWRSPRTASGCGKVATMLGLVPTFLADAAEEGLNVILGMLIVGLIFVAVIALGMLADHMSDRRYRARQRRRAY
jgi:threonine/homoserine/homoserine lactone efflux protein